VFEMILKSFLLLSILIGPGYIHGLQFDPFESLLFELEVIEVNETSKENDNERIVVVGPTTPGTTTTTTRSTASTTRKTLTTAGKPSASSVSTGSLPSSTQSRAVTLLKTKINKFINVPLETDSKFLTENEKNMLASFIKAASYMDPIFDQQVWTDYPRRIAELKDQGTVLSNLQLQYMDIMRGPWDRYNLNKPFAIDREKPKGAGFYPEDMTEKQFEFYVGSNPDKKEDLESPVTLVKRNDVAAVFPVPLYGVPYSEAYKEWLTQSSQYLRQAANITENQNLKKFLNSRASAFLSNKYDESNKDWLDVNSKLQIAIGPYGLEEDKLKGLKASFEAIVFIKEQSFKAKFRTLLPENETEYQDLLPELEANLPVPEEFKNKFPTKTNIQVAELVYSSGNAKKYPQQFTFDYTTVINNNKTLSKTLSNRKIVLSNVIFAFYENIMTKFAQRIMKSKQLPFLDEDAFFMNVLYRELSHSLGPVFVGNDEARGSIKQVLGTSHQPLEEAKAGVMGVYNLLKKVEKTPASPADFKNKVLFTYIASLLQRVRDDSEAKEGKGAAVQLNRYLKDGSIVLLKQPNPDAGKFQVNYRKLEISLNKLLGDIVSLQHKGDKDAASKMLENLQNLESSLIAIREKMENVPVDIVPVFQDLPKN